MKSCPFCGSNVVRQEEQGTYGQGESTCSVFVICRNCFAKGPDTGYYGLPTAAQRARAIELWDTRTEEV